MKNSEYINKYCVGCGLCKGVGCAELEYDSKGFPSIRINSRSMSDNTKFSFYDNTCPVFYYQKDVYNGIWGKIHKAYISYSANEDVRFRAASGGALTEISCYLLENKIVDAIFHTTYNPDAPTETISCVSHTINDVRERCGSRYSISVPLSEISRAIEKGKTYAFVGKPCDVMALRRFMDTHSEYKNRFKFLISFFCAGEPSVEAQKSLLKSMGSSLEDCQSITYRGCGWPGYTIVINKDGSVKKTEYQNAWGNYLGRDLRDICRFCLDGTGELADIVCADFWQLDENGHPDFSEHEGRNIILTRSEVSSGIVEDAIKTGYLVLEDEFTDKINELHKYQPNHFKRKSTMRVFVNMLRLFGRATPKYNKRLLKEFENGIPIRDRVKFATGVIKRIMKGRL